ncbi:unnamed protein product [Leptidea sinapis]|uniref:sulfite oxidase n=2 Tax=Leptidea sinapis TaxID=189913 RepID=A0A5E4QCD0_9NEOP|nr:unnamed protein product [Leptidea sinapis]
MLIRRLIRGKKIINYYPILFRRLYGRENNDFYENDNRKRDVGRTTAFVLGSVLIAAAVKEQLQKKENEEVLPLPKEKVVVAGEKKPGLPTFTAEEVSKHDSKSSFWVTYKHGVYDVTPFLASHPGGEQIYNAAGLSIEPFWNVYGMHKTPEVFALLESLRIGNLADADVADYGDDELWAREPYRDRRLILKTARPFNAETPPKQQVDHFDTPNELFYVRQHMPVPELDARTHQLQVMVRLGEGERRFQFSLGELEQFPSVTVRAALMCAGNRRSEMNAQVKPVKGLSWAGGAISNAVWGGVRLRDVLLHCGLGDVDPTDLHVILTGADVDATGVNFSTSIPLHMALDPTADILLATQMNGTALPLDHGYPLRAVVPGAAAVRSVKWLESITISKEESPSHWHQKDYRSFNASKTWETADFSTAPPIYHLPVTSYVCEPADGEYVPVRDGHVLLRVRVDVSSDRGRSWSEAELQTDSAAPRRHYSWTLWSLQLPVQPRQEDMEIWVKATDSNFNTQPETFENIWNIRGILSNAYHRIHIHLKHET